jgi:hypothetical protein
MRAWPSLAARAAIGASLVLVASAASPAAAQEGDLCGLLTVEEVAAAIPGEYGAPMAFPGTCGWSGTTAAGSTVDIGAYEAPGSAADMPGAEVVDIAGHRAFSMTDPSMESPTHVVGVESGSGVLLLLTLSTADPAVDLPGVAAALAETAVGRYESGVVSAAASTAPGGAPAADMGGICELATPQEIASAAGLDMELTVQDLDVACSYEGTTGEQYVLIYVMQQDPGVFGAMLGSLGAEEVDGPGDEDWWAGDLLSLFSRKGDLVLQVSYTSSAGPSADEVKEAALAVMSTLMAP